ncbi:MAG TPA: ester cyclase [Candidatus Acidoferrales bacterium]|nr:ester cyclase [Candidatus Acidoferrales bacterium]
MAEASSNLRILGKYSTRMMAGDYSAVREHFAEEFTSHVAERVNPSVIGSDIRGHEEQFWEETRKAFPDREFTINLLIESGDLVVSNWTLSGTHTGGYYYDVPPSGQRVTINGTAILRFKDGKVVEHWGGPHCMNGVGLTRR